MHGGFYPFADGRPGGTYVGTHIGGDPVWLTTHHYDTIVSETRITSYLGILTGQVPGKHYFAPWRTFPATCDWSWHEMQPVGETRTYLGIDVYEGAYTYRDMHIVPGWGGSMFEELMPAVFVPVEEPEPLVRITVVVVPSGLRTVSVVLGGGDGRFGLATSREVRVASYLIFAARRMSPMRA